MIQEPKNGKQKCSEKKRIKRNEIKIIKCVILTEKALFTQSPFVSFHESRLLQFSKDQDVALKSFLDGNFCVNPIPAHSAF